MIYECEKCETPLSPGLCACPQCDDPFDEPVPADAELPPLEEAIEPSPYALVPMSVPSPRRPIPLSLSEDGPLLFLHPPTQTPFVPKPPSRIRARKVRALRRVIPLVLLIGIGFGLGANYARQSRHNLLGAFLTQHTVTYRVTGTVPVVDLTYQNGIGGTEQINDVRMPWKQTYTVNSGTYLYLSAQSRGTSGRVITEIDVDGTPRKTAATDGAYTTVYVNDSL